MSAGRSWYFVVMAVCERRSIWVPAESEAEAVKHVEALFHHDPDQLERTDTTIIHTYARTDEFGG